MENIGIKDMEDRSISINFGGMAPPLTDQIKAYGADCDTESVAVWERARQGLLVANVNGWLTDKAYHDAVRRLGKHVTLKVFISQIRDAKA